MLINKCFSYHFFQVPLKRPSIFRQKKEPYHCHDFSSVSYLQEISLLLKRDHVQQLKLAKF